MPVLVEGKHTAEFLVTEGSGYISRDQVVVASGGGILEPGTVIGAQRVADTVTVTAAPGNTGDGTVGEVTTGSKTEVGIYTLVATATTKFDVITPSGDKLKGLAVGTAYASDHINLTVTAGGPAFVAGDTIEITVAAGNMKVGPLDLAADDGTQVAYGILYAGVDATAADVRVTAITRHAEVNGADLLWPAGITAGQKSAAVAQLADRGIIVR